MNDAKSILFAIFSAVLAILLTTMIKKPYSSKVQLVIDWTVPLLLILVSVLISFILVKQQNVDQTLKQIAETNYGQDFRILDADEASTLASEWIKKTKIVCVIGTARQDMVQQYKLESARRYLKETENRMNSREPFTYHRITLTKLRGFFRNHLITILRDARKNPSHIAEISFIDSNFPPICYQIFDDKRVIIIVDNNVITNSIKDYGIVICCTNKRVVSAFKHHFNDLWSTLEDKRTNNTEEFKKLTREK